MSPDSQEKNLTNEGSPETETKRSGTLKKLGKYVIQKKLGSGGMGAVFLAHDTDLKRTVALKVLPRQKAENPTLVERFRAEAQSAAKLKHDNIVTIYEAGEADGFLYLALEYIDGTDVQKLIEKRGFLPVSRSLDIMKQVTSALAHAHEQGIVHRDIKPANLLIRKDGSVTLADLGLARAVDEERETGITRAGTTVGTVDYMSPEQARDSKAADIRSDIYSLGCTWYHMLTGEPPFNEGSMTNKLAAHAMQAPPDPREFNEKIPDTIVAVVHRMMAKKPEDRHQTPAELLADLENAHLRRGAVPQNVLAGLAEDSSEQTKARPTKRVRETPIEEDAPRARRGRTPSAQESSGSRPVKPSLPPKERRKKKDANDDDEKVAVSIAPLRVLAAVGLLTVICGAVWYLIAALGGALDNDDGENSGRSLADAARERSAAQATEVVPNGAARRDSPKRSSADTTNAGSDDRTRTEIIQGVGARKKGTRLTSGSPTDRDDSGKTPSVQVGRDDERSHFPEWVGSTWSPSVGSGGVPDEFANLPFLTVGGDESGDKHFNSLDAALSRLPGGGGIVALMTAGPYRLRPVRFDKGGRVLIVAGRPDVRPVVVLRSSATESAASHLMIAGGSLTLDKLDVIAPAQRIHETEAVALVHVESGDLIVRDCSVTMLESRQAETSAFSVSGEIDGRRLQTPRATRVLFDRVSVRGSGLTAISLASYWAEVVASDSLFVTGAAPVCRLSSDSEGAIPDEAVREVLFASTTAIAHRRAFELKARGGNHRPPKTHVRTINSVVATGSERDPANTMLALSDWPLAGAEAADGGQFKNLQWSTDQTLYLGWDKLVVSQPALALDVNGAANWEKLWGKPVERVQFQPRVWPSKRLGSPAFAAASLFRASTIPGIVLTASDGQDIGCRLNRLTLPSREQLDRSLALSNRPVRPEPFEPAQTLRVDATKRDLGRFLAETNYKDRTVVVVTGHGMRKSSPIHVRGKRLRLRFETTGDTPLVLMPRDLATRSLKSADDYRAFIEVVEGGIEIVGGMFRIGSSASKADPQWFLSVEDGDFSIRQTYVTGPMLQSNRYQGLIDWRGAREAPAGREYAAYGEIVGSSLLTKGTLLKSPLQGRALHVHNSLLVSLDDLTTLTFPAQELPIHSTLDIAQSTLSSGGVCFDLIGARQGSSSSPLRLFVDQTVFSVPVKSKVRPAPRPVIVRCSKDLDRPGNVVWWGTSNAFALDVVKYLDDGREPVAGERQAFRNVWPEAWGEGHVSDALAGRGDVLLTKALPVPSRIRPEQFALEAGTPAATAGTGGESLGARVTELPDPAVKPEGKTNDGTGSTKKKAKSGRTVLE